ncbi:MAG TPA: hypothetical protein VIM95_10455 [Chitinimonas sp.]
MSFPLSLFRDLPAPAKSTITLKMGFLSKKKIEEGWRQVLS